MVRSSFWIEIRGFWLARMAAEFARRVAVFRLATRSIASFTRSAEKGFKI